MKKSVKLKLLEKLIIFIMILIAADVVTFVWMSVRSDEPVLVPLLVTGIVLSVLTAVNMIAIFTLSYQASKRGEL